MAFDSHVVCADATVCCSDKPHCEVIPCVHHLHHDFRDMKQPSNKSAPHIHDRSQPPLPPSTNPSRRVVVRLLIIFFVTFTSATLLQALGYLLFAHWEPHSPPHVVNEVAPPIVVRPSVGLREPYVAHSIRHPLPVVTSTTPTFYVKAIR